MEKYIYILIFLIPQISFSQLYKCDSLFNSANNKIHGGFKNELKHGTWTYSDDTSHYNIIKVEKYWFGELINTNNSNIEIEDHFEKSDSIIEYYFGPTVKHILSKTLISDTTSYFYCELEKECDSNTKLIFYKLKKLKEMDQIDKFCSLTNRYIRLNSFNIPVISRYDREFANLNWNLSGDNCMLILDESDRIIEMINTFGNTR